MSYLHKIQTVAFITLFSITSYLSALDTETTESNFLKEINFLTEINNYGIPVEFPDDGTIQVSRVSITDNT